MSSSNGDTNGKSDKPVHLRLFDFSEDEVKAFNYYEILGLEEPVRATPYTIKQAYRKASIRYHPDKTGRDESDYVFIAVKSAWDTLSDVAKRQAYDSTEMPFDDAIPPDVAAAAVTGNGTINGLLYTDDDFFDTFGPVFERNLRFDTRLQQQTKKTKDGEIPTLGDLETPIEKVQAFYGKLLILLLYCDLFNIIVRLLLCSVDVCKCCITQIFNMSHNHVLIVFTTKYQRQYYHH